MIETIKLKVPPGEHGVAAKEAAVRIVAAREAAVRELGEMASVRAIPHIIDMWGDTVGQVHYATGVKDHHAGCKALVAIGKPAVPFLEEVLRGGHPMGNQSPRSWAIGSIITMAIRTCVEMGPEAEPLLLEYRKHHRDLGSVLLLKAVRAIEAR